MSHYQHGYSWPSLATPSYRLLLLAGLQSCCMYVQAGRPAFARPCEGVHWSNIIYEHVPTSPAVSRMSGSSNFDSFRDGW